MKEDFDCCDKCKKEFPEDMIQPFFSTRGNFMLCAPCALEKRNKMHGFKDNKFNGSEANKLLFRTKEYLRSKT